MQAFSHSFGDSTYHLWWITKCRYKILRSRGHKYLCRDVLMQIAKRHGFTVQTLSIGNDHVHIVAAIPPTISLARHSTPQRSLIICTFQDNPKPQTQISARPSVGNRRRI